MNNQKKTGIWMDHSSAHIMTLEGDTIKSSIVTSQFTHQEKEESLNKSEGLMHHKEQHEQQAFYKKIEAVVMENNEIVLFGPTDAKTELFNLIRADHRYEKIKIGVIPSDKMNEHQMKTFVIKYFSERTPLNE